MHVVRHYARRDGEGGREGWVGVCGGEVLAGWECGGSAALLSVLDRREAECLKGDEGFGSD